MSRSTTSLPSSRGSPKPSVGRKHQFGYMMANAAASAFEEPLSADGAILKYDLDSGARDQIDVGSGRLPGESSFVPKADATSEGRRLSD